QLRWARTVRLCRPLSYLGLLFTQGLPWMVLAALAAPAGWIAGIYPAAYVVLRSGMAWTVGGWGVGDQVLRRNLWLVPVRDAIYFVVWLVSFGSNRIRWGPVEYAVRNGRMVPIAGDVKATMCLGRSLDHERPYLFTFLYCPGLDATNNVSERAIRALIGARKNWGGNRTPRGARAQAVLTSILQTAKQQGKKPFAVLLELLCGRDH